MTVPFRPYFVPGLPVRAVSGAFFLPGDSIFRKTYADSIADAETSERREGRFCARFSHPKAFATGVMCNFWGHEGLIPSKIRDSVRLGG